MAENGENMLPKAIKKPKTSRVRPRNVFKTVPPPVRNNQTFTLTPFSHHGAHVCTPHISETRFQPEPCNLLFLPSGFSKTANSPVHWPDTGKAIGGWDPAWDIFRTPAPRPLMPPKLHKNERDRAARADKVGAWGMPRA